MQYRKILYDTIRYRTIQYNILQFQAIPCNDWLTGLFCNSCNVFKRLLPNSIYIWMTRENGRRPVGEVRLFKVGFAGLNPLWFSQILYRELINIQRSSLNILALDKFVYIWMTRENGRRPVGEVGPKAATSSLLLLCLLPPTSTAPSPTAPSPTSSRNLGPPSPWKKDEFFLCKERRSERQGGDEAQERGEIFWFWQRLRLKYILAQVASDLK